MVSPLSEQLDSIDDSSATAVQQLRDLLTGATPNDAESVKVKEDALARLCDALVKEQDAEGLSSLLVDLRPMFAAIPKAKTAKIVRTVIDAIARVPGSTPKLLEVCRAQVDWATAEKRSFLRQRLETRLAGLLLETRDYTGALALLAKLLSEVKKLDDKLLLVDIYLLESQAHHALGNLAKSRAALVAGRAAANAVYIPPATQADLDTQSGLLHAEEGDHITAYSYFYEAHEAYAALGSPRTAPALKYMLLSRVMRGEATEVEAVVTGKAGPRAGTRDVEAMRAVAKAYAARSLHGFQAALGEFGPELRDDAAVATHLETLYGTMLENNLLRLLEPYSRVEVARLAQLIDLPVVDVEDKLSRMILDKKVYGTLDQGLGVLEVWDEPQADTLYGAALDTFDHVSRAVDRLQARSVKLMAAAT